MIFVFFWQDSLDRVIQVLLMIIVNSIYMETKLCWNTWIIFPLFFEIEPKIDYYRIPTHKHCSHKIIFYDPFHFKVEILSKAQSHNTK